MSNCSFKTESWRLTFKARSFVTAVCFLMGLFFKSFNQHIRLKQLISGPADWTDTRSRFRAQQICHRPATAISGLQTTQLNFTFVAAKRWFAAGDTNWKPPGSRTQSQEQTDVLSLSGRIYRRVASALNRFEALQMCMFPFQHLVMKRRFCGRFHRSRASLGSAD